jgi:tripartite-type tricarboxylate transporter receptor subunit TctC
LLPFSDRSGCNAVRADREASWAAYGRGTAVAADKVNAEVNRAVADPSMRERLSELGGGPIPGSPEDFGRVIAAETEKWSKIVISSGAKVD